MNHPKKACGLRFTQKLGVIMRSRKIKENRGYYQGNTLSMVGRYASHPLEHLAVSVFRHKPTIPPGRPIIGVYCLIIAYMP